MNIDDVISAVRRSNRAWWEQVCESESLDFGVAYTVPEFPTLAEGNQLRDAWIADADPETVYQRAEAYYQERGLVCRIWTPASGQDVDPVDALMARHGWVRSDLLAFGLVSWDAALPATERSADGDDAIRILPARAMRRAYRALLAGSFDNDEPRIESGIARLDDSNFDAVIAQVDGTPAGRIAYFEVGEIARLADLHLVPGFEGRGIERELIAHFLQIARRLSPRHIVACVPESDASGRGMLEANGFAVAGSLPRWLRNAE